MPEGFNQVPTSSTALQAALAASDVVPGGTSSKPGAIDTPNRAWLAMNDKWTLLNALRGGTQAMRAGREAWLPKEKNEDPIMYEARLGKSFLFNGYADTIDKLVSKPFARPVQIQEDGGLPDRLRAIAADVDKTGKDLTQFSREVFDAAMNYGLTHVLVDFPTTEGQKLTLEDERTLGIRPVFIHVPPTSLIGWQTEYADNGLETLKSIRFSETRTEADGNYGEQEVHYIRVYTKTAWEVHRKMDGETEYTLHKSGTHTFGRVPLFTMYFNRKAFMIADPPLEDLAWMNLVHWQSYSDHRNALRFARIGLLFFAGVDQDQMEQGITIGPGRVIRTRDPNGKMMYVEQNGAAIAAGERDLKAIEDRMEALGMQPLVSRPGTQTATGKSIDEARTHSAIKAWVRACENFIETLYDAASRWTSDTLPEKFAVDISDDFGIQLSGATDMSILVQIRQAGELSRATFLKEAKRRGFLADEVDVDSEMEAIEDDAPLYAMGGDQETPNKAERDDKPNNTGESEKVNSSDSSGSGAVESEDD
jgi:hypothetical protein